MKKWPIYCILSVFIGFSSCETDFEVNQDWTEIPVIYGLLNQAEDTTYIRVQKAFLGNGDALVYAGISDSIYHTDNLSVKIEEWKNEIGLPNGILIDSVLLIKDSTNVKDTGLFANNPHIIYKSDGSFKVDDENKYRLIVKNKKTGVIAKAQTGVVENIIVSRPPQAATAKIRLTGNFPYVVTWLSQDNGKIHDLVIRFFWEEVNISNPSQKEIKHIDWNFPSKVVANPDNPTTLKLEVAPGSFYKFLESQLQEDPTVDRYYCHLDFIFSVGSEELYTYIQVNEPPLGIVQEKPEFSNINGGLGIFSSRYSFVVENKLLDSQSAVELEQGEFTKNLGFVGSSISCP